MSAPSTYPIGTRYGVPGKMWAAGHHTGIDFLAPTGSSAKAPTASKILHAGKNSSTGWGAAYGIHVIGESKVGGVTYRWIIAHLREVQSDIKVGQSIARGKIVGKTNATGNVTGPHLHFEVRKAPYSYGHDVNPQALLAVTGVVSTDKMDPAAYFLGANGPWVTWLGERLIVHLKALGITPPYASGAGPVFTETDLKAVALFQHAQGWSGADADGLPGAETLARLAAAPPNPGNTRLMRSTTLNRADYDSKGKTPKVYGGGTGRATRAKRTPYVAPVVLAGRPDWIHLQECDKDQVAPMDKLLVGYTRIGAGGKGRESWRNQDSKITPLESVLVASSTPQLAGDDKPYLLVAYSTPDGFKGVEANFHNENEGTAVQKAQLASVMKKALALADKHEIPHRNVHVTGDSNRTSAATDIKAAGWVELGSAATVTNTSFASTNGWGRTTSKAGRIDVEAMGPGGRFVQGSQDLLTVPVADHNPHHSTYELIR